MHALNDSSRWNARLFSTRAVFVVLASVVLLAGCGGGGGDAGEILPESITITTLDGPSGGEVGKTTTLNVKVATTGGIEASEISYVWEQTAGTVVLNKSQGDGNYESTLSIVALVTGDVTFKVTVSARGKTGSQSKTIPISS